MEVARRKKDMFGPAPPWQDTSTWTWKALTSPPRLWLHVPETQWRTDPAVSSTSPPRHFTSPCNLHKRALKRSHHQFLTSSRAPHIIKRSNILASVRKCAPSTFLFFCSSWAGGKLLMGQSDSQGRLDEANVSSCAALTLKGVKCTNLLGSELIQLTSKACKSDF